MAGRARHLESTEDRTVVYRDWHRKNLPDECKVMDVDQLEYRFDRDGHIQFRAIIELTIFDPALAAGSGGPNLRDAVKRRIFEDTNQGRCLRTLAKKLDVPALVYLIADDLSQFWVYDIVGNQGWWRCTLDDIKEFLVDLPRDGVPATGRVFYGAKRKGKAGMFFVSEAKAKWYQQEHPDAEFIVLKEAT